MWKLRILFFFKHGLQQVKNINYMIRWNHNKNHMLKEFWNRLWNSNNMFKLVHDNHTWDISIKKKHILDFG